MFKQEDIRMEAKKYLRSVYPLIRESYKFLSSIAPAGAIPCIGMNVLSGLMLEAKDFVDYNNIKLSDIDLSFISSNAASSRIHEYKIDECNNPERGLIRFQFMEVLCRLGTERYCKKPPHLKQSAAI